MLSSVLDAVDQGFRVIVVEDGLCSSSDAGHDALMTIYRTRLPNRSSFLPSNKYGRCGWTRTKRMYRFEGDPSVCGLGPHR
jgi:hypothetical protein